VYIISIKYDDTTVVNKAKEANPLVYSGMVQSYKHLQSQVTSPHQRLYNYSGRSVAHTLTHHTPYTHQPSPAGLTPLYTCAVPVVQIG